MEFPQKNKTFKDVLYCAKLLILLGLIPQTNKKG